MKGRRFGIAAVSAAAAIAAAITIGHAAGLRFNFTHSAPSGLWHVQRTDVSALGRGELVEVCPPASTIVRLMADRGYLEPGDCAETNVTPLLKPIAAVAGDRVTIAQGRAVTVNGHTLPNTAPMKAIPAWQDGSYTVAPGQVWLFSTYSAGSFDSRYFGPVNIASVRARATPILIGGDAKNMTLVAEGPHP